MTDFLIRPGVLTDLDGVFGLSEQLRMHEHLLQPDDVPNPTIGVQSQVEGTREAHRRDIETTLTGTMSIRRACFVAEVAGTIVGYVTGSVTSDEEIKRSPVPGRKMSTLHQLFVAEGERGNGIGSGLVDALENWAIGRHAEYLGFLVLKNNVSAQAFYQHKGYMAHDTGGQENSNIAYLRYLPQIWW